jgi:hypothetical protein
MGIAVRAVHGRGPDEPAVVCARRGHPGSSLVNGLDGELRQFALAELNRTSMTTVAAALVAVSEFTSHEWIGQIDVPVSVLVTTHDTIVPAARQRRLAGRFHTQRW